jgi:uncharacterized protein (TIGR03083 family)
VADVTDPIASLRSSHERLRSVVEPLTAEQIRQRAYPTEWSIAQVLSHLGSGSEIGALIVEAGKSGGEPPSRESFPTIWDRWNAKDPDAMVADGLAADARLVELVETLRDPQYAQTQFRSFMGDVDRIAYTSLRLGEHAVHTWDVVVAVQPGATVSPDAVEIILPGIARLVGFTAKPNGRTARIHVTTTDPSNEYALTLGEQSSLVPWDGGEKTATLTITAEAFLRLLYGRMDAANTPAGVEAKGITLDDLRSVFPGF